MSISLGEIELKSIQNIKTDELQALIKHRIPGLEGDIIQNLGRHPTKISFEGILMGEDALTSIENLRQKFKTREPVAFVSDITGSTDVTDVVIEDLRIWELGGRPNHYGYIILVKEYIKIAEEDSSKEIEAEQEKEAQAAQKNQEEAIENGTTTIETRVELEEGRSDYTGISVEIVDPGGNVVEVITEHTEGLFRSQPLPAGEYTVVVKKE
jgi:hypothetical protein